MKLHDDTSLYSIVWRRMHSYCRCFLFSVYSATGIEPSFPFALANLFKHSLIPEWLKQTLRAVWHFILFYLFFKIWVYLTSLLWCADYQGFYLFLVFWLVESQLNSHYVYLSSVPLRTLRNFKLQMENIQSFVNGTPSECFTLLFVPSCLPHNTKLFISPASLLFICQSRISKEHPFHKVLPNQKRKKKKRVISAHCVLT